MYFTAAIVNGSTLTLLGYRGTARTYRDSFVIDSLAPTFRDFGWTFLTTITFVATGGTDAGCLAPNLFGDASDHEQVAIDNLIINADPNAALSGTRWLGDHDDRLRRDRHSAAWAGRTEEAPA